MNTREVVPGAVSFERGQTYAVFLSHNSRDKPLVTRLGDKLKRAGLEPWIDAWCLTPGGDWQTELATGLRASGACAVFVGPHGLGDWEREELGVALDRAAKDRAFRVFLVLLPGAPEQFDATALPPFLVRRTWIDLRTGLEDSRAFQRLINAIKGVAPGPTDAAPRDDVCPYRGLRPFDEEHAQFFFGREGDTQRLIEKLKITRFLAVLGASGSGKSSLVRAGLLPALRGGLLPGSTEWTICTMRPGAQPIVALAASLVRLAPGQAMQQTVDQLTTDARTLHLAQALAHTGGGDAAPRWVWVIDQFEELFTLCADERERAQFIANLLYAASVPGGSTAVVLTMRSDFYHKCAAYPELAAHVAEHQFLVSPMDADGLRQSIEEPARHVGLEFEEGLVSTILDDVTREHGALPLLEHALLELWERRRGSMLTLEAYRETGGVSGAIAKRAETIFTGLRDASLQSIARRVLLRLTQPGDGTPDTRRRAAWSELITRPEDEPAVATVVGAMVEARLLTTGATDDGERWVDVSHEALIRGWPRLQQWIDEDRAGLRVHQQLTNATRDWLQSNRDDGLLYRGARLAQSALWRESNADSLNDSERAFLDASVGLRDRDERARRKLTFGLGAGSIIVLALILLAGQQWSRARSEGRVALARRLAIHAGQVPDSNTSTHELRALLALESLNASWTMDGYEALATELSHLPAAPEQTWTAHKGIVNGTAVSPDGKWIVTGGGDGTVGVWHSNDGKPAARLPNVRGPVYSIAFSPDGRWLAVGYDDEVRIWETTAWRAVTAAAGADTVRLRSDGMTWSLSFSPDSRRLAVAAYGPEVARTYETGGWTLVDSIKRVASIFGVALIDRDRLLTAELNRVLLTELGSHRELAHLATMSFALSGAVDGSLFGTVGTDSLYVWQVTTAGGATIVEKAAARTTRPAGQGFIAFSPHARYVAVREQDDIRVREAATLRDITGMTAKVAAFSADERHIVAGGKDGTIRLRKIESGPEFARIDHDASVRSVVFSKDGQWIATASGDSTVQVFRADSAWKRVARLRIAADVAIARFTDDGRRLIAIGSRVMQIFDVGTWRQTTRFVPDRTLSRGAISPDGRWLIAVGDTATQLFDVQTRRATPVLRQAVDVDSIRFSADGQRVATDHTPNIVDRHRGTMQGSATRIWTWNLPGGDAVARADTTVDTKGWLPARWFRVQSTATSRDSVWTAAANNSSVEISAVESDHIVARLVTRGNVNDVAVSPNSQWIAVASDDRTLRIIALEKDDIVAAACARLTRNMSIDEWNRYFADTPSPRRTCPKLPAPAK